MKAEELMIGDYVQLNGSPYVIEEISKKGWVHMTDPVHNLRVQMSTDYILDFIEGIPLTSEILEVNGWERHPLMKYNDEFRILDDYYELNIHEFNDGTWNVQYDCIEMGGIPMCSMNICYVHELQHLLRLLKIEKTIEL